jgi:putative NADH-flavin reductase
MKIALIGGTGGIGRQVLARALELGHQVRVLAREPGAVPASDRVEVVAGSLADASAVASTVAGTDVVIWAVGAASNSADQVPIFEEGATTLVAAMQAQHVRRLIAISGAGITVAGERKPLSGRLMTAIVRVAARHVYEAKLREYQVFSSSDLDWTLIRPPRVVEGPRTGHVVVGDELVSSKVTQGDVADAMLMQLDDRRFVRLAPFASSPK